MTEESFISILRYENGVVMPQMTELDKPCRGVYGDFKLYMEKLISIRCLLSWKNT